MKTTIYEIVHFEPITYKDGTDVEYGYSDEGVHHFTKKALLTRAIEADAIARRRV